MKTTFSKQMVLSIVLIVLIGTSLQAQYPRFKVLAFYNKQVESAHVDFANDAIKFFKDLTIGNGFVFDLTTNMDDMNDEKVKGYQLVMMLNDFPNSPAQKQAFQKYMKNGGGWMGFHVAAYNDRSTKWPWFVDFLGGGVFYRNNWPPLPAKLVIDDTNHPITIGLPNTYIAPANEWYQWKPSPRERKNVKVLASLSTDNYPLGLKDILPDGDTPVIWTNTDYRMIYLNMGHGGEIFKDATQNKLIIAALRWVIATDKKGNVFER
ncbi:ThuA domain-containing protein [Pedobacter sp. MC2016-24]|uniref:ThuA domain-containing protein n=1 Tax=Pedobacter sp. MC2016-24 TaxID=2780090 RepID=UPI0018805C4B|nr:ThuA domain-containing protein [Pedobacter sp. MC2016-24]MBE9598257.1 ThuA domain-containing protein [Pedobacter sp. MC2016-24]